MARPKKIKPEVIDQFKEDPSSEIDANEKIIITNTVPKYEEIVFLNNRDPGQTLYFHYQSKTHPLKHYTLAHGLKYNLPVEVIKHLEGMHESDPYACHTRMYSERKNYEGLPETYVSGYKANFQCKTVR